MSRHDTSADPHPAGIVLLDYLEGDLPTPVLVDVRRHLARCRDCRRALTDLCGAVEEIEALPTTSGASLHAPRPASPRPAAAPGDAAPPSVRARLLAIGGLLAAAAALWLVAQGGRERSAGADPTARRTLAAAASALGGELVRDGDVPGRIVLIVPAARSAEARDAATRATASGLRVDVAVYAR